MIKDGLVISKLIKVLDNLTDEEDIEAIKGMIKKRLPKRGDFEIDPDIFSKISGRFFGAQDPAIRKCSNTASEFVGEDKFEEFLETFPAGSIIWHEFLSLYSSLESSTTDGVWDDLKACRAYVSFTTPPDLKSVALETFDLYATHTFIEKYTELRDKSNELIDRYFLNNSNLIH